MFLKWVDGVSICETAYWDRYCSSVAAAVRTVIINIVHVFALCDDGQ